MLLLDAERRGIGLNPKYPDALHEHVHEKSQCELGDPHHQEIKIPPIVRWLSSQTVSKITTIILHQTGRSVVAGRWPE